MSADSTQPVIVSGSNIENMSRGISTGIIDAIDGGTCVTRGIGACAAHEAALGEEDVAALLESRKRVESVQAMRR